MKFGVGQSVRRTEDLRLVTGRGQYTDDFSRPNQAYAVVVRSPHAAAKLLNLDVDAARAAPGVIAVMTSKDVEAMGAGTMPCLAPVKSEDGSPIKNSPQPLLATDRVRWAGQPVAFVVAESLRLARDAAELVAADYDMIDAVGTLDAAAAEGAPLVWDHAPGNVCFTWAAGDHAATEAAFASAKHKVSVRTVQNRVLANPMEPRAALGEYDAATDHYTLTTSGQGVTNMQNVFATFLLKHPKERVRVIQPDVGGGFGMKAFAFPEQALCLLASKATGRPVKWAGDRTESFVSDAHGRDMVYTAEGAFDAEGRFLALRVTGMGNLGAYLSQYAPFIPTMAGSRVWGGVYRIPKTAARVTGYFSNTAPVDAYRGAGRPEAAYFMERLMDCAAAETGLSPVEIRRRNLVTPAELPYANWVGMSFDSGNFEAVLNDAAQRAGLSGIEARRTAAARDGKLRGIGVAYYVEITGTGQGEPAVVTFLDNGQIEVKLGTQSNGQGHETSFAQILAERLGVPFDAIHIKQGDSDWNIKGGGTGGSRSLHMSGGAILNVAAEVIRKGTLAAAHMLEASEADIAFSVEDDGLGRFRIAGTDRAVTVGALAMEAKRRKFEGLESGLDSIAEFSSTSPTFPNGCHVCEVEIDKDTGVTRIVAYTVVDDFGKVINPMILAGQVHGGVVQGIGQALMEHAVYDPDSAQLLSGSFMDYTMPRADDLVDINFHTTDATPCLTNPLGSKGCGEAGTVGALAAVMNAVTDALKPYGVRHVDMPATPEKIWRIIHGKA